MMPVRSNYHLIFKFEDEQEVLDKNYNTREKAKEFLDFLFGIEQDYTIVNKNETILQDEKWISKSSWTIFVSLTDWEAFDLFYDELHAKYGGAFGSHDQLVDEMKQGNKNEI